MELPYPDRSTYFDNTPTGSVDPGLLALYTHLDMSGEDNRDQLAEGYGSLSTGNAIRFCGTITDSHAATGWCEWAYLFTDELTLLVFEIADGLTEVARFSRSDLLALAAGDEGVAKRVAHAECGEDYSRCAHVVWVHVKAAPEESKRLSMREWVGLEPLRPMSAIGAIVGGRRYEFAGGGGLRHGKWEVSVKGEKARVPVFSQRKGQLVPLPRVELIYPPVAADVVG